MKLAVDLDAFVGDIIVESEICSMEAEIEAGVHHTGGQDHTIYVCHVQSCCLVDRVCMG